MFWVHVPLSEFIKSVSYFVLLFQKVSECFPVNLLRFVSHLVPSFQFDLQRSLHSDWLHDCDLTTAQVWENQSDSSHLEVRTGDLMWVLTSSVEPGGPASSSGASSVFWGGGDGGSSPVGGEGSADPGSSSVIGAAIGGSGGVTSVAAGGESTTSWLSLVNDWRLFVLCVMGGGGGGASVGATSCLISGGESGGSVDFSGWISGSCSAEGILGFGARGGLDLGRRLLSRVSLDEEETEDGGEEGGLWGEGGT